MEILSVGQKIKRARIYKGLTLKQLCGDKISVSKLSCIENDKVKPDEDILKDIALKLGVETSYLKAGVKEQLLENIETLKNNCKLDDYEERLEYNLKYAEEYEYFNIAFYILHMLLKYYLKKGEIEKIQLKISKYYDYWLKSGVEENKVIYYMDIAKFFYISEEYIEAASYYNNIKEVAYERKDYKLLADVIYNEAICYIKINEFTKSYERAIELIDLMHYVEDHIRKAEIYRILAILSLKLDRNKFEIYESKSYEFCGEDLIHKAEATFKYASIMFDIGEKDKATDYINKSLELYPKEDTKSFVIFMLDIIKVLLKNDVLSKGQELSDEVLNYAIKMDNLRFIEKAYYYKGLLLERKGNLESAEMYMNLSLDSLLKFGNKKQIYDRYMKMGDMYHKMDQTGESIKYFNLAIKLSKRL
ncbi:helix-turn-helix transcriptional regulator [Clostridium oceanicum]|uniref:Helix-turn-helix transcriptional regulator n=1 Tax=Clostridium oceanicum TaxID=1543 RepID=A0ABP3V2E7_9CLOT